MSNLTDFLKTKAKALHARARSLRTLTPALTGTCRQNVRHAPSPAHFKAANDRLRQINRHIQARLRYLDRLGTDADPQQLLIYMAMVEKEIDRARRTFGMYYEIFSQRAGYFGPVLLAHDVIAEDCYAVISRQMPTGYENPVPPLTYMEHGYSPATMRRGIALQKLSGEKNPFPLIRIPWDRDNPWQSVFLHEVSHNLQADLGLWQENKKSLSRRLSLATGDATVFNTYIRWQKEIFADIAAVFLGGTATVLGMMDFLAHPREKTLTYKPGGLHPTGFLRVLIMVETLNRLGFYRAAGRARRIWARLYRPAEGHRIPGVLLSHGRQIIPHVVDEIGFQAKRNLAQRALADVIPFRVEDEKHIRQAALSLQKGAVPEDIPPRFLLSASRHALGGARSVAALSKLVIMHLQKYREHRVDTGPATGPTGPTTGPATLLSTGFGTGKHHTGFNTGPNMKIAV